MDERIALLKDAHQEYVDWWLPIDVAGGSLLAPVGFLWFLHYLLTMPSEHWWDRWVGCTIPKDKHYVLKRDILRLIIEHHKGEINVYEL